MDYNEFNEKYQPLLDAFRPIAVQDIKTTQVESFEKPTLEDIARTEELTSDFLELDDSSRQEHLPFLVYQFYVDTQSILKYFTSKDIDVDQETYTDYVSEFEGGRTKLSFMVNKLFMIYDGTVKKINRDIETYHHGDKAQFKYLDHTRVKIQKLFYKGRKKQSSKGSIKEISSIFEKNHGGFFAKSKVFKLSCDQYIGKSKNMSINKKQAPATLKTRMKEVVDAKEKVENAYKELGDSNADCEVQYQEIKKSIDADLDTMVGIYTHVLDKAREEVPSDKELLTLAYDDPFEDANDIDSITTKLVNRKENLRIIAGYLDQDSREVEKVFGQLDSHETISKALQKNKGFYADLRSRMVQFSAQIDHHNRDLAELAKPEKEIREINEEISRLERSLPDSIQEKAMARPVKNLTGILELMVGEIEHIVYKTLDFKEFNLQNIRGFKSDLENLDRSYHRLVNQTGGPAKRYLAGRTDIQDVFEMYKSFINVAQALKLDKDTYVNPDLEDFSKNRQDMEDFHLKIKRQAKDLPSEQIDILNEEIEDQKLHLDNKVRSKTEKELLRITDEISREKVSLEDRITKAQERIEVLMPIMDSPIPGDTLRETYDIINKTVDDLIYKRDSWTYKIKKQLKRFKRRKLIEVKGQQDFLLDTSTIVHDPQSPLNFEEHNVYIPWEVVEEINSLKDRDSKPHIRRNIRDAISLLEKLGVENFDPTTGLSQGMRLNDQGGMLYVLDPIAETAHGIDGEVVDNRIIQQAIELKKKGKHPEIVSNDKLMRFKSHYKGVRASPYTTDMVEPEKLNIGYREIEVDSRVIEAYRRNGRMDMELDNLVQNEVIVMQNQDNPKDMLFTRYRLGKYHPVNPDLQLLGSIGARNTEQVAVMEGLMSPDIELLAVEGPAGTGKSILSLAAGIDQVHNEIYKKIMIYRAFIDVGKGVGFLKGSLEEKVTPWFGNVWDALDSIAHLSADDPEDEEVEEMIRQYMRNIEVNPLFNIRGTSKTNMIMMGEEWQNTTPHESKTFITRAGENTKVVLVGDIGQIDEPRFLSAKNNGLSIAIKAFNNADNFMGIRLVQESSRSRLADQANRRMP